MSRMASAATKRAAVKLYLNVGDARQVAKRFPPYRHQTILNWVRELGAPVKPRGGNACTQAAAVEMFRFFDRYGLRATINQYDCSRHRVERTVMRVMEQMIERLRERGIR